MTQAYTRWNCSLISVYIWIFIFVQTAIYVTKQLFQTVIFEFFTILLLFPSLFRLFIVSIMVFFDRIFWIEFFDLQKEETRYKWAKTSFERAYCFVVVVIVNIRQLTAFMFSSQWQKRLNFFISFFCSLNFVTAWKKRSKFYVAYSFGHIGWMLSRPKRHIYDTCVCMRNVGSCVTFRGV